MMAIVLLSRRWCDVILFARALELNSCLTQMFKKLQYKYGLSLVLKRAGQADWIMENGAHFALLMPPKVRSAKCTSEGRWIILTLSRNLEICQSMIKIIMKNPNFDMILTSHHTPIRNHPEFGERKNQCLVLEKHIQFNENTESSLLEACQSKGSWNQFRKSVVEVK